MKKKLFLSSVFYVTSMSLFAAQQFPLMNIKASDEDAISKLTQLTNRNPVKGRYWFRLADAHLRAHQWQEAREAFKHSYELGYEKAYSAYNLAVTYAKAQNKESAIRWLEVARNLKMPDFEQSLMQDKDFNSIKGTNEFKRSLFPALDGQASRVDKWLADIDFLSKRFEQTHFDLSLNVTKSDWNKEIERIINGVPNWTDAQIYVALQTLIASLKDGHSMLAPIFQGPSAFKTAPMRFAAFSDGVYLVAAAPEYQQHLGKKLTKVGKASIDDALKRIEPMYIGDNRFGGQWIRTRWFLTIGDVLNVLDLTNTADEILYEFEGEKGERDNVRVPTAPIDMRQFTYVEQDPNWITVAGQQSQVPLWQQKPEVNFWGQTLGDDSLEYLKINRIRNNGDNTLVDFVSKSLESAAKNNQKALVIDLRSNSGGNGQINYGVVSAIVASEFNQKGRLFVLTGNKTFSAAHQLTLQLSMYTEATFVGEPTGSAWTYRGESNSLILPNNGLMAMIASRQFQGSMSDDHREAMAPDIYVPQTGTQFIAGEDPVLEAVKNIVK